MNRREVFKAVAGVAAAAGVKVEASTVNHPTGKPALAIFEVPVGQFLSQDASARLAAAWENLSKGTAFEGTKALVLDNGLKLTLIDADGHVLNRTLEGDGGL